MVFIDEEYCKYRDIESMLLPMCSKQTISERKFSNDIG